MTKRGEQIETCERCRKRSHRSNGAAIHHALHSSKIYGAGFRAYKCPHGVGWHLTRWTRMEPGSRQVTA